MCDKDESNKDVVSRYNGVNKSFVLYALSVIILVCVVSAIVVVSNSIRSDKERVLIESSRDRVREVSYIPQTGLYPEKSEYVFRQIDNMVNDISVEYGIDINKVRVIYRILGLKPVYTDKSPNIYTDLCVRDLTDESYFEIINYYECCKKIQFNDLNNISSRARLADVVYSAVKAFNDFQVQNAISNQAYIDNSNLKYLSDDDKYYIKFSLDILDFIGKSEYKEQYCIDYKKIIDILGSGNIKTKVLYTDNNTESKMNSIISKEIITDNTSDEYIQLLSNVLSGNMQFISDNTFVKKYEEPVIEQTNNIGNEPLVNDKTGVENNKSGSTVINKGFIYGNCTRENMMLAATSLVGKVRYIWGGGHGGGSQIAGVNPLWERFNEAYKIKGINSCIQSSSGDCPIHRGGGCGFSEPSVHSIDGYVETWKDQMQKHGLAELTNNIDMEKMYSIFRDRNSVSTYSSQYVSLHSLDGLDCSGFACWLYNQVDTYDSKDTVAIDFVNGDDIERIKYGEPLYPGDSVGWDTHIIIIFGKFSTNCYITIEQTPDVLRFGACSLWGGSVDLQEAKEYANELNKLAGVDDGAIARNLDNYRYRGLGIGRLNRTYDDEGAIIQGYDKSFENLSAKEIVEVIGYEEGHESNDQEAIKKENNKAEN